MPTNPQHQHGLPPRGPGPNQQRHGGPGAAPTRSPMQLDYGRSPTPGTPSRTPARRLGTSQFRYYTPAQLEAISKRQGTRASGWDAALELKRRKNYVEWIHALCKTLGLPYVVIETAIFYMHRYFAFKVRRHCRSAQHGVNDPFWHSHVRFESGQMSRAFDGIRKICKPAIDCHRPPQHGVLGDGGIWCSTSRR